MRKQNAITNRKPLEQEECLDGNQSSKPLSDRDRYIMSELRKLRPLGCRMSLKKMEALLEGDRGKPHCKVIEDFLLKLYCKEYCEDFLKACRKVLEAKACIVAKKVLKSGFLSISEVASFLKLNKAQVKKLQASMA